MSSSSKRQEQLEALYRRFSLLSASERGSRFATIASNSLRNRNDFANEAGNFDHGQPNCPASTPLI
jgi:CRISPR/Cas system-associated protein Cas10 (large subunit of type III CRISPR-Cas system)